MYLVPGTSAEVILVRPTAFVTSAICKGAVALNTAITGQGPLIASINV